MTSKFPGSVQFLKEQRDCCRDCGHTFIHRWWWHQFMSVDTSRHFNTNSRGAGDQTSNRSLPEGFLCSITASLFCFSVCHGDRSSTVLSYWQNLVLCVVLLVSPGWDWGVLQRHNGSGRNQHLWVQLQGYGFYCSVIRGLPVCLFWVFRLAARFCHGCCIYHLYHHHHHDHTCSLSKRRRH